jgi:hypothetical protein
MISGKDFSDLLLELLHAHLAPASAQAVKRARRSFKTLRNAQYPVSEEKLLERVSGDDRTTPSAITASSDDDLSEPEDE